MVWQRGQYTVLGETAEGVYVTDKKPEDLNQYKDWKERTEKAGGSLSFDVPQDDIDMIEKKELEDLENE